MDQGPARPHQGGPAGRITGARLIKDAHGWTIVFRTQTLAPVPAPHTGAKVGMDRGIAVPLALSTGEHRGHGPWLTDGERTRLLRLERKSARQRATATKGKGRPVSNRLARTYDQIAKLRATAKRRALDWQHQTTTDLATRFSAIVVEDLEIINMTASASGTVQVPGTRVAQKRGLNRAIAGEAWGRTVDLLTYKSDARGGVVAKVRPHGTSRECHRCHTTSPGSRESQSRFACRNPACGWVGNADTNAARNLLPAWSETTDSGTAWTEDTSGWAPQRGTAPTGVLVSVHDVTIRRWAERDHNVVRWTELDRGGHFLAMEAPDLLIADVREFFSKLR